MAFTNIVTDALGNSGNSASVAYPGGAGLFVTTGDDFTSVTNLIQWSEDNTTFYTVATQTSISSGLTSLLNLPKGYVRVNLTGGGAGDNIDVNFKVNDVVGQSPLIQQLVNQVQSLFNFRKHIS